jgi:hypothetical protein
MEGAESWADIVAMPGDGAEQLTSAVETEAWWIDGDV